MSTGVGCTVYIDGDRMPDGSPGDNPLDPTALSGLKVTWGRETTLDQPEPNTCTFAVMDDPGGQAFLEQLRTGRRIEVFADGTFYPDDPSAPMFQDPSFEAAAIGSVPPSKASRARVVVSDRRSRSGGAALAASDVTVNRAFVLGCNASTSTGVISSSVIGDARRFTYTTAGNTAWNDSLIIRVGALTTATDQRVPVTPGQTIYLQAEIRASRPRQSRWRVSWYDAAGVAIPQYVGDPLGIVDAVTWGRAPVVAVPVPAGAVSAMAYLNSAAATTSPNGFVAGDYLEVRRAMFTVDQPFTDGEFFDGSTPDVPAGPGVPGSDYAWMANANASPSTRTVVPAVPLGHSAQITLTDAAGSGSIAFAPAPFSTLPDAWDELTPTNPGARWKVGASVFGPPGAAITVSPVRFARPDGGSLVIDPGTTVTGSGTWQTVELAYQPSVFGQWVGVAVTVAGLPRWIDVPGAWTDWAAQAPDWSWRDSGTVYVDDVVVIAPAGGTVRSVEVFSGRVTDLVAAWDDAADAPVVQVTAQDFTADLANIDVGDEPWTVESMQARFQRIVALTGMPVQTVIDAELGGVLVSWQDVDAQASMNLLRDLAQSVDGVLWSAVHATSGAYLWVENPSARAALFTLADDGGVIVIVPAANVPDTLDISACDVLRDPVQWEQSVSDVSTRVAVSWLEQTLNDKGQPDPTERTVTVIDAALEIAYGKRRISLSTILQSSADATQVANRLLGRTHITDWRASGFAIDDDDSLEAVDADTVTMMLDLLDGTQRIGKALRITDLPDWSPSGPILPVYLEGGEYVFDGGTWTLNLTVSHASAQGQSAAWADLEPAWQWVQFDPTISWLDMAGVRYPD